MVLQVQQCLNLEIDDVFLLGRSGDLQDVAPATVCCQSVVLVTLTIKWPQLAFDTVLGLRQRSQNRCRKPRRIDPQVGRSQRYIGSWHLSGVPQPVVRRKVIQVELFFFGAGFWRPAIVPTHVRR